MGMYTAIVCIGKVQIVLACIWPMNYLATRLSIPVHKIPFPAGKIFCRESVSMHVITCTFTDIPVHR